MNSRFCLLAKLCSLFALATISAPTRTADGDEPLKLGYERWSDKPVVSGAVLSQDLDSLYGVYADKMTLVGPAVPACGRRLIDIDVFYSPEQKKYLSNAIWIENKDDYKATSYFFHGLTYNDVQALAGMKDWLILDIESYAHSAFSTLYAVILRSNPLRFKTKLMVGISLDELQTMLADKRWRPIDIDMHQTTGEYVHMPSQWNETMNWFDAVFVSQEQFSNKLNTWVSFGSREDINMANSYGQVIDVEITGDYFQHYFPDEAYLYIVVDVPSTHSFEEGLSTGAVAALYDLIDYYELEDEFSRCVDLEGGAFNPDYNPLGIRAVFKH